MSKEQKTKEQLLVAYKKANKTRKLAILRKAGYSGAIAYIAYLNDRGTGSATAKAEVKAELPKKVQKAEDFIKTTVHVYDVLDATGSMGFGSGPGTKYDVAKEGIKEAIVALKSDTNVEWKYYFKEFIEKAGYQGKIKSKDHFSGVPISSVNEHSIKFTGARGGDTPLYKTVVDIIKEVTEKAKGADKILLRIYTDGGNNTLSEYQTECTNLIRRLKNAGHTVTFIATIQDLTGIVRNLDLDASNTLAVTNDSAGFTRGFAKAKSSTALYSSKVAAGEDVSFNFYGKQSGTL